ncbi:MAG: peptidylprolyl isomerase, partial [Acidobacteriota bacterium]
MSAAALALAALVLLPVAADPQAGADAPPPDSLLLDPDHPTWEAEAPERFRARFRTSEGDFTIEVDRELAPRGADRFYNLVRHGFYDDTRFYRVVPGSWVQFGVSGDPDVTAAWEGRTLSDDPVNASNVRGAVAFAHTGPGTRLTQVFVNLDDNTRLDADGFAPFGRVAEGMEVIESLYAGYGEEAVGGMRAGRQGPMLRGGNAYLDEHF